MANKAEILTFEIDSDVNSQIAAFSKLSKRSPSAIINEAVASYVRDQTRYLEEIDAAVSSAGSGHGHSGDQIFAWMHSWGTSEELPSPEPDIHPAG